MVLAGDTRPTNVNGLLAVSRLVVRVRVTVAYEISELRNCAWCKAAARRDYI